MKYFLTHVGIVATLRAMKTGRVQLKAWMNNLRLSYRVAGKMLGIHWAYLNQLVNGHRSPSMMVAGRIQTLTGVPIGAWVPTDVAPQRASKKATGKRANVGRQKTALLTR